MQDLAEAPPCLRIAGESLASRPALRSALALPCCGSSACITLRGRLGAGPDSDTHPYEISAYFNDYFPRSEPHRRLSLSLRVGSGPSPSRRRSLLKGCVTWTAIVAGARDPHVPRHLGYEVTENVEEAVTRALTIHGPGVAIGLVG
jgi:hypothetical protein